MTARTKAEQALQDAYDQIPQIPDCDGRCADACGPIAMFRGEWDRVKRSAGFAPRMAPGSLICPLLSPTGKCTVYTVRPYICRLWGATRELACPHGCQPQRWLSVAESREIFEQIKALAGPRIAGPAMGRSFGDLWDGIGLEARERRSALRGRGGPTSPAGGIAPSRRPDRQPRGEGSADRTP